MRGGRSNFPLEILLAVIASDVAGVACRNRMVLTALAEQYRRTHICVCEFEMPGYDINYLNVFGVDPWAPTIRAATG
jgi:hypothetical protein